MRAGWGADHGGFEMKQQLANRCCVGDAHSQLL